jgi:hypothetical protein
MTERIERKQPGPWWTTTKRFVFILSLILFLCLVIVYLLTPETEHSKFWNEVMIAVAGAALVVILVHIADRLVLLTEVSTRVEKVLIDVLDQRITRSPWNAGVVNIHRSLDEMRFAEIVRDANNVEICILDTYIPDALTLANSMLEALKHGCKFKFLVLKPDSAQAITRGNLLARQGLGVEQFKQGTNIYLCTIGSAALRADAFDRIEVRLYEEPPVVPLYILRQLSTGEAGRRDRLFFGFYLDVASYGTYHLELARLGEPLFETLEGYFNRMWDRNQNSKLDLPTYIQHSCPVGFKSPMPLGTNA